MFKTSTALLFALLASGCAMEGEDAFASLSTQGDALVCVNNSGVYPMKASLSVAMANEMGELNPVKFLAISNSRVVISQAGLDRCAAKGKTGCPNVDAILSLQSDEVGKFVPPAVLDPTNYRQDLMASFNRQKDHEANLVNNYPSRVPTAHTLTLKSVQDLGACGDHYIYHAATTSPQNVDERLVFFGSPSNPYLAFFSTETDIGIDPTGTMNGGTTTTGVCTDGCTLYDATRTATGACCTCNGVYGTYTLSTFNRYTFVCKTN